MNTKALKKTLFDMSRIDFHIILGTIISFILSYYYSNYFYFLKMKRNDILTENGLNETNYTTLWNN
jgi:hypothetical protein